ncbi:hypothetical protein BOSE21B_110836 [Bosea sp. 21B]|nr:hypothetical protein BOSE21B_110836 [Bosea sp. 21B]CAD5276628.1 hypothetical protein BOSE7B_40381 [Bosea sp. 7B]VXC77925.1 hypothetical protein BOSE127_50088 [Bosea sp. 127]
MDGQHYPVGRLEAAAGLSRPDPQKKATGCRQGEGRCVLAIPSAPARPRTADRGAHRTSRRRP